MKRRMTSCIVHRALALGVLVATPLYPCGGPAVYEISAPLVRAERMLEGIEVDFDGFDAQRRSELRFLAPFLAAKRPGADALWMLAYGAQEPPHDVRLDTAATFGVEARVTEFDRATKSGSRDEMVGAASRLLQTLLNTPSIVAEEHQREARRAVALLEVQNVAARGDERLLHSLFGGDSTTAVDTNTAPQWARDIVAARALSRPAFAEWGVTHASSLRAPAAAWAAVGEAMRRDIPNGWASEIRDSVPAELWRSLAALHTEWLARFEHHPLAPWVRLSRARLAYVQGDSITAWNTLLDLYTQAPVRAAAEMRYLLQKEVRPPSLDDARIDNELRAALLAEVGVTPSQWNAYWSRADASGASSAHEAWRRLTKERLLWQAAGGLMNPEERAAQPSAPITLPSGFPTSPRGLSPLAAGFRALALTRAGRHREAMEQTDALGEDSLVAPLRAHLLLDAHRWSEALAVKHVAPDAKEYLLRVLAPDSVVALVRTGKNARLARVAARTQALRLAGNGKWNEGAALLPPSDAVRRPLWLEAATRASDTTLAGTLAYARWLRARRGSLLGTPDKVWYRSVSRRLAEVTGREGEPSQFDASLPWSAAEEHRAIVGELMASYEMFHAVRAYARVLERMPPSDAHVGVVLREANVVYNWLASWDNNNSRVFQDEMERAGIGGIIRRAGKRR